LNRANEFLNERRGAVIAYPGDRILSAPPEADSWNDIKRNQLFRIRIAVVGQALAESVLDATDEIASAIASEVDKNSGHQWPRLGSLWSEIPRVKSTRLLVR
jgi:hypothetical protein